jgi:hypothetical protein
MYYTSKRLLMRARSGELDAPEGLLESAAQADGPVGAGTLGVEVVDVDAALSVDLDRRVEGPGEFAAPRHASRRDV